MAQVTHTVNNDAHVAVSNEYFINEDMSKCPRGVKVQLLNVGGVLTFGTYDGKQEWRGWAPLPRIRKRIVAG